MGTRGGRRRESTGGLEPPERTRHRFELGAVVLAVGLGALAATASADPAASPPPNVRARTVTLVDSSGAPAAHVEWDDGQLRIAIPAAPPKVREIGEDLRAVAPGPHSGAELLLRPGRDGPSLLLRDGRGNEMVRLGAPAARPAHD